MFLTIDGVVHHQSASTRRSGDKRQKYSFMQFTMQRTTQIV